MTTVYMYLEENVVQRLANKVTCAPSNDSDHPMHPPREPFKVLEHTNLSKLELSEDLTTGLSEEKDKLV